MKFGSERAGNKHVMMTTVNFTTDVADPRTMDIVLESKISESAGKSIIYARAWATREWVEVGRFKVRSRESSKLIQCIDAPQFVDADGRIQVRVKQVVKGNSFRSWIDQVAVGVR